MKNKITKKFLAFAVLGVLVFGSMLTVGIVSAQAMSKTDLFNRVAEILGVDSSKLTDAFKQASTEQVDQNLAAGEITQEQADKMKEEIANGNFMHMNGPKGGPGSIKPQLMEDLASYLGVTTTDIHTAIESDQTLSDYIISKGKTVDDVKAYLAQKITNELNQAVTDGKITQDKATEMINNASQRVDDFLSGKRPDRPMREKLGGR